DHINHFSKSSLHYLLEQEGFIEIDVDDQVHDAAFVVKARYHPQHDEKPIHPQVDLEAILKLSENVSEMAQYWKEIVERIKAFEASVPRDGKLAIYGAGFYGSFIDTVLANPDHNTCFV